MGKIIRTDEATGLPIFERPTPTVNVTKTNNGYEVSSTDEATGLPVFKKKSGTTAGGGTSSVTAPKSFLETFSGTLGELAKGGADFLKKYPEAATGFAEWEQSMHQKGQDEKIVAQISGDNAPSYLKNAVEGAQPANVKLRSDALKQEYQNKAAATAENIRLNEVKIKPALAEIVGVLTSRASDYFKNGVIDYEKVYKVSGEISKNLGGGDNVKEVIAPIIARELLDKKREPRVEVELDALLKKEKGYGIDKIRNGVDEKDKPEIERLYQVAYKKVVESENEARTFTNEGLKNAGMGGAAVRLGAGLASGLNRGVASMGSGIAATGINNSFTDWMRGRKNQSEDYDLPDAEISVKNLIKDPVGVAGTRTTKQIGNMLPMIAATVLTKSPYFGAAAGFTTETLGLMGEVHDQTIEETGDPEKAKANAGVMFQKQQQVAAVKLVESSLILKSLSGIGKAVKNIVTENVVNLGEELYQGYHQQALGLNPKSVGKFLREDGGEIAMESIIASTGMMGAMSGVGKVYAQVTKASPDAMQQHLASIIQQDGWMGASKHLNALYESGQINANEFNKLVTGGKAMSDTMKKMEADGIGKKEVLAAATLSVAIDKLQARHDAEKSVPIQKTISKKIAAKQKELDGIMEGRGGFMTVEVAGGSSFVVAQDKAAEVMSGIKEQVADGTATITINPLQEETATAGPKIVSPEVQAFRENNPEYASMTDEEIGWAITDKAIIDGTTTAAVSEPVLQDAGRSEEQGTESTVSTEAAPIERPDAEGTVAVGATEALADNTVVENKPAPAVKEKTAKEIIKERQAESKVSPKAQKVNDLLALNREYQNMPNGRLGKDKPAGLQLLNKINLGVNDLGLAFDGVTIRTKKGKRVTSTGAGITNKAINPDGGVITERGEKTQAFFEKFKNETIFNGLEIIGADGRKMNIRQLETAIDDVRKGVPSYGATALMDAMDSMAEDGMVNMNIDGSRFGVPLDEYFTEHQAGIDSLAEETNSNQVEKELAEMPDFWEGFDEDGELTNLDTENENDGQQIPADSRQSEQNKSEVQGDTGAAQTGSSEATGDQQNEAAPGSETVSTETVDDEVPFHEGEQANAIEESNPKFKQVVKAINKMFGKVKGFGGVTVLDGEGFADKVKAAIGVIYRKANGTIYGFADNGKIYLNGDALNLNTPVHEASHLFTAWAKDNAPELHRAGLNKMRGTEYEQRVNNSEFYKARIKEMRKNGATQAEIDDYVRNEALAMAVGDSGQRMVASEQAGFKKWLKDLWEQVKGMFGKQLENFSAKQIEQMTFGEFADATAKRILSGKELVIGIVGKHNNFQVTGEKAKLTKDEKDNLDIANAMEKANADSDAIFLATGWERGVDGKWRMDVNDMDLNMDVLLKSGDVSLKDIVKGDKTVIEKYPELADAIVTVVPNMGSSGEYQKNNLFYNEETGSYEKRHIISLNAQLLSTPKKLRSVLIHEIQHGVQEIEGFAPGGNADSFITPSDEIYDKIWALIDMKPVGEIMERNGIAGDYNDEMPIQWLEGIRDKVKNGVDRSALSRIIENVKKPAYRLWNLNTEFNAYHKLAGEVEARNVQSRVDMPAGERAKTPISKTEDTKRSDQLVIKGSAEPMESAVSPEEKAYGKAVKDLREAEDKVAQEQAQQTDLFGGGTQQGMFGGMSRDDVQGYLKPFKDKVAAAKTAMEKAAAKPKTDGKQIAMFSAGAPANPSTQKMVERAQKMLEAGKTADQIAAKIVNETFLTEAEARTVVDSAMNKLAAPVYTTQPDVIDTTELRETIINFGKELRKKYWQGVKEGGQNTAATFKGYEQMRDNIRTMITDMLRTTKKMGLIKGDLPANVWPGIIRRLTKAKTSAGLLSFYDYFKQVLKDVNYETKLTAGNNFRNKIKAENKRKSNDKNAATKKVYSDFAKLDPAKVSDINEYLALAEKVLNAAQGIKAKGTATTDATVKNESLELSAAEVNDYLEQQYDHMAEVAAQKMAEQYADMVEMGVIDPNTMSAAEMQEIMDAVNLDLSEEVVDAADIKHAADEKKMAALRAAVDYNRMGLADVDSPDMTDTQRKIVDELRRIDLTELTASQLAKLNDAVNNILVNGDYTGAGQIAELADVQQDLAVAAEAIEDSGIKLGSIDNMFIKGFASTQLLNQFIFKLNRLTSEIQRRSGIHGIMSGHAKAKNLQDRTIKQYEQLKKGLKDIDSALNKYRRGIYADVFNNFGGNTMEVAAEFERRKGLVQETAKALTESSDVKEQQEGALVQQVYDELLADSPDILAVTSKMNAINPNNIGLVQFWQNAFDQRKAQVQENTEVYNNKIWEDVENYTATKYKGIDGEPGVGKENQVDNFDKETTARGVSHKMAGTKNTKTRNKNLPKGSVLNLDFDNVQSRAFYETNYDVFTAQAISAFKLFIKHPKSNEIFGGKRNKQIVLDSMRATVLQQKGRNPVLSGADKLAEAFEKKVLRRLQAKGARIALGSIMQLPKQYISVATSTLVNLGTDAGLYFKAFAVSNKLPLFDQYAIGQRGGTQAGYNKDVDFGEIDKADFSGDVGKAIEKVTTLGERIAEKIMTPLVAGDVSVARTSWLSYYMKSLQDQGLDIEGRDWANEHIAPNDEAAAFAEQMVSRSQNPNDASALGEVFKARGTGKLMSRIFMPFSTFSTNMRMRITNDMQKLTTGTAKAKKEAATSLAATVVETVVFNAIKVYAIQYLTTGLAHAIAGALGFRGEDDEKKEELYKNPLVSFFGEPFRKPLLNDKAEKLVGNSVSDLLFGGMGSGTQNLANYVVNTGWAAISDEQYADGKINRYPQLYYNFKGADGRALAPEDFGIYGISIKKAYDILDEADEAIFGKTGLVVKNDNPNELLKNEVKRVSITPEEQQAYALMFLIDALSLAGAGDAEISQANAKLKRLVDKKMQSKTRYGGAEFKIQVRGDEELDDSEE